MIFGLFLAAVIGGGYLWFGHQPRGDTPDDKLPGDHFLATKILVGAIILIVVFGLAMA